MIGDRELEVMQILWKHGSATVAESRAELGESLAYTTVLTILRNLERKKLVRRSGEGRAHRYFPRLTRNAARRRAVDELLQRYFSGKPAELLLYLAAERVLMHLPNRASEQLMSAATADLAPESQADGA